MFTGLQFRPALFRVVAVVSVACVALAFPGAGASSCRAATAAPDTALYRLAPVVVTAVGPTSPLTFTTDPRAPRQPVPATDGGDYLRTIPGFAAIRNGGTNGDPVLRGMFGSRLNVLTNGAGMLGACPGRMDAPTAYIAPETFDRLTVVKGPQTVAWGPGASAGTVRFDRVSPTFETFGARVASALTGGSWGRNDQFGDVAIGGARGWARANASRSQQGDYEDGDGALVPSGWYKWNADVALGLTPGPATMLALDAGASDGHARYAGRAMDGTQFQRRAIGLRASHRFGRLLDAVEAQAGWFNADHVMDNFSLRAFRATSAMPNPTTSNVDRRTFTSRAVAQWSWRGTLRASTGLDQQANLHLRRSVTGGGYLAVPWVEDAAYADYGGFAELAWNASPALRVVSGARADLASVQDRRTVTAGAMPRANPTHGDTRTATLPSGFARVECAPLSRTSVYAGVGHSERFPDYWELFSPNNGPAGAANAFAGVDPERVTQVDAGAQVTAGRGTLGMSVYAVRVVNDIVFRYTTGGMMGTTSAVRNVLARIAGGEAGASWSPAPGLNAETTVAIAWGRNETEHLPLAQTPPLESRVSLAYDAGRGWSCGALARFVAAQDRVALGEGNVVGRDLGRTPGFGTLALHVARRLPHGTTLALGVDNLFNRTYAEHLNLAGNSTYGYPATPVRIHEPGRTAWLKLNVKS